MKANADRKRKDATDRKRKEREEKRSKLGLKPVQCWVLPEDEAALKEVESDSQARAKAQKEVNHSTWPANNTPPTTFSPNTPQYPKLFTDVV